MGACSHTRLDPDPVANFPDGRIMKLCLLCGGLVLVKNGVIKDRK